MQARNPHPLNASGDFYVEDGCCTSCEMPFTEAPGHFQYDDSGHCYVCKQPITSAEVRNMISAVSVSEVSCIRYAGSDAEVLSKLIALNEREQCDALATEPNEPAHPKMVWWALWRR